jgi:hypothetical protein
MNFQRILFSLLAFGFSTLNAFGDECSESFSNERPSLQVPFSEWSNGALISQTSQSLEYLKSIPYKYPDVTSKVNGRIVIYGMPGVENNLHIKILTPDEVENRSFRFFTTMDGLSEVLRSKRLQATSNAYQSGVYYYKDLTGILLSPPEADLQDATYWRSFERYWVDVKLPRDTKVLQMDSGTYLIPGASPTPDWLLNVARENAVNSPSDPSVQKLNGLGWTAAQIPVVKVLDFSNNPARLEKIRKTLIFHPKLADQPIFEMFPALRGEENYPGNKKVVYFTPEQLAEHKIVVRSDGRLIYAQTGKLFSSTPGTPSVGVQFPNGDIYMSAESTSDEGRIQHSSFNGGGPVASAFVLKVLEGEIQPQGTNESGHYLTSPESVLRTVEMIKENGGDTSKFSLKAFH